MFTFYKIMTMNFEQHKTKIIQKLHTIQDEKMLDEIEVIVNGNYIVGYTIAGDPLTKMNT
jgi:uncharacterized protein (UPF0297 family)